MLSLIRITLILLISYMVYCAILFFAQRNLLYPGQYRKEVVSLSQLPYPAENVALRNSFGTTEALFVRAVPDDEEKRPVVVFAHGNGERITDWVFALRPYLEMGIHVFLVEYPGYGHSGGRPSQKTISATFRNSLLWLGDQQGVDGEKIIFHGRSLGGAVLAQVLDEKHPAALILQSTFISLRPFARRYFAPAFLLRDPFDGIKNLSGYTGPTLVMHGKGDAIVPFQHAERLKEMMPQAQLIAYECGHNDLPPSWQKYWANIQNFLQEYDVI